jgi:hypothetical protein
MNSGNGCFPREQSRCWARRLQRLKYRLPFALEFPMTQEECQRWTARDSWAVSKCAASWLPSCLPFSTKPLSTLIISMKHSRFAIFLPIQITCLNLSNIVCIAQYLLLQDSHDRENLSHIKTLHSRPILKTKYECVRMDPFLSQSWQTKMHAMLYLPTFPDVLKGC